MDDLLFYGQGDLRGYLNQQKSKLKQEIEHLEADYILKVSETDLEEYLAAKHVVQPLQLNEEAAYRQEPRDTQIDVTHNPSYGNRTTHVTGTAITVSIPFTGESQLFHYQPSHYTLNPPRGSISGSKLELTYTFVSPNPDGIAEQFNRDLASIKEYVEWANRDVTIFNESLRQYIRESIRRRKEKLLADREVGAALGIPLKKRQDAPKSYSVPVKRRRPKIQRPKVDTEDAFEPEPALAESEYNEILKIVQSMVEVIERSPHAFSEMGEEDLRQHFLVQLNGQYQGQATGETFNYTGKTDILIRVDGKNIFIAECKFWRGPKSLRETIDQLLGYTSWRDTKAAILLFNRNKYFSKVLEKVPGVAEKHGCYKRTIGVENETTFRYVFHQPSDPNRELLLTVLAFDVPVEP